METGLIGGLIGAAIGLLGGALGTYCSIRNTHGPRERAFMVQVSVVAWLVVLAFLAGLLLLPPPYNWLLWIPYAIGLPLSILWLNRQQTRIREEERTAQ